MAKYRDISEVPKDMLPPEIPMPEIGKPPQASQFVPPSGVQGEPSGSGASVSDGPNDMAMVLSGIQASLLRIERFLNQMVN